MINSFFTPFPPIFISRNSCLFQKKQGKDQLENRFARNFLNLNFQKIPPAREGYLQFFGNIRQTNKGAIPVSVKASFDFNSQKLEEQWFVSKKSTDRVLQLILLYLGNLRNLFFKFLHAETYSIHQWKWSL